MEETLKIMTEFILEKCTALEMENKRLSQQLQKAEDIKDQYYDGYSKQAEQLAAITRFIKPRINWQNDKAYALHIYDNEGLSEIVKILRITKEDIR